MHGRYKALGLGIGLIFMGTGTYGAEDPSKVIPKVETPATEGKPEATTAKPKPPAVRDVGIGLGLLNPMPGVHFSYNYDNLLHAGVEYGALTFHQTDLDIQASYYGLDFKYLPWRGSFFFGLGLGARNINTKIQQLFTTTTDNQGAGTTEVREFNISWQLALSQNIASPRIGWLMQSASGATITLALGLAAPFGTKFSLKGEPESLPGVPTEVYDREKNDAEEQGTSFLTTPLPLFEAKFSWFFDAWG